MCTPRIWLRRVIEAEPFEVWGGEPRRDLLYVDDAAEAVLYAVVTREAGGLALNVGREEPCADLAEAIIMAHAGREIRPLLKSEWVEVGDPAPLCRRTHGGAGARALALVKPLPPTRDTGP